MKGRKTVFNRGKTQNEAQRSSLKGRGIKPGKVTKDNPKGQASGGWSPFGPPAGQKDVVDDVEYEAYDRVRGVWFTYSKKR